MSTARCNDLDRSYVCVNIQQVSHAPSKLTLNCIDFRLGLSRIALKQLYPALPLLWPNPEQKDASISGTFKNVYRRIRVLRHGPNCGRQAIEQGVWQNKL